MNNFGVKFGSFTSDYSVIDADFYDPFEHVNKDEHGFYVILEDGRKIRFPSLINFHFEIANDEDEDSLDETA